MVIEVKELSEAELRAKDKKDKELIAYKNLQRYKEANIESARESAKAKEKLIRMQQAKAKAKQFGRFRKAVGKVSLTPQTSAVGRLNAIRKLARQPEGTQKFRIFGAENSTIINPTRKKLRYYEDKEDAIVKKSVKQMRWY